MDLSITASEFKATCLDVFDRVADGEIEQVVITKRGRVVGILHPPAKPDAADDLFGCMAGSVTLQSGVDLTAPPELDPFDAQSGLLHR